MVEHCAFHPDRATTLHCTRCGRPACPDCLTPATVGFHCRACVQEARRTQRTDRTVAGARTGHGGIPMTSVLIAVNLLVFVITALQARDLVDVGSASLSVRGMMVPALVGQGEYWRVLSSGFLHVGLVHVAVNMLSLYMVGRPLETVLGRGRFLVVYLLSLVGGSAGVMLLAAPVSAAVGASGAIFGLLGALAVTFRRLRANLGQLAGVLAVNLFITFSVQGISWQAHVGGLVVGAIAGAVMVYPPVVTRKTWQVAGSAGLAVLLALVIVVRGAAVDDHGCGVFDGGIACSGPR